VTDAPAAEPKEQFAISHSRHFLEWLVRMQASIAFTTYQASKLFFLGVKPEGRLAVFERTYDRSMGLGVHASGQSMALATRFQIYRFDNVLPPGEKQGALDALYAPHAMWVTGDLDAHDIVLPDDGRPIFVNTLFSCLATVSDGHSFKPLWKPDFITRLAAEDRCHLNGLAAENGKPRYVTLVSASNVSDGWRDRRSDGGMVIDIESNERIVEGLSMPHSPRLHNGKLWVLNSGAGEFGYVDIAARKFVPIAFCPGYARGLALVGNFAIIGLSLPRESRTFQGLPLDASLKREGAEARCGLIVIDLTNGDTVHWVRIEGIVTELYDVAAITGVHNPGAIGFKTDEIHRVISIEQ
jgi:uncharacterized protein (TIGR03032 family)